MAYLIQGLQGDGSWKTLVELDESVTVPDELIVRFLVDGEAKLRRVDANGETHLLGSNPNVLQPEVEE